MKKILIAFLMTSTSFLAQEESDKKVFLGASFSPDYSYRTLSGADSVQFIVNARNESETPKIGHTTGVSAVFQLNKRLAVETGLKYSNRGDQLKLEIVSTVLDPSLLDPSLPDEITFVRNYHYLGIPVKGNLYLLGEKMKLFISIGGSADFYLSATAKAIYRYSDGSTEVHKSKGGYDYSLMSFSAIGGFGVDYNVSDKLNVRFEPVYRRALNSIIDAPIKGYYYSIGVNFGLYYKL